MHDRTTQKAMEDSTGRAGIEPAVAMARFRKYTYAVFENAKEAAELLNRVETVRRCTNEINRAYARVRMDDFLRIRTYGAEGRYGKVERT